MLGKPEESVPNTLKRLAGQAARKVLWDPKVPYETEDFDKGKAIIGSNAIVFDSYQEILCADV